METLARPPRTRPTERRAPRPARRGNEFLGAIESVSDSIRDPIAKLRFIRGSLHKYERLDSCVRLLPAAGVRRFFYRWLSLEGLQPLFGRRSLGAQTAPASPVASPWARRATSLALLLAGLVAAAGAARQLTRATKPAVDAASPRPALRTPAPLVAEPLAPPQTEVGPARVWLVERGTAYEQYSNGLRIETGWVVPGEARRYHVFAAQGGLLPEARREPAGLLFHTTESDLWPLEAEYNERLRDSSERLLRYLQRNRTYHYLVDRFGRVFRVVEESAKANHAGNSIWENDDVVYLNLNHAFLGISFESRWGGGQTLPITQAQLVAGRNLTDHLRQRFSIPAETCVVHGLTSVNPKLHRIGHHLDWSRGFPWTAFGLPDQYAREPPSVARFGFGYDEDFLKVLPEPWAGVLGAETRLREEADKAGRSLEDVRQVRQRVYDRWVTEQAQADSRGGGTLERASDVRPQPAASGG